MWQYQEIQEYMKKNKKNILNAIDQPLVFQQRANL